MNSDGEREGHGNFLEVKTHQLRAYLGQVKRLRGQPELRHAPVKQTGSTEAPLRMKLEGSARPHSPIKETEPYAQDEDRLRAVGMVQSRESCDVTPAM